MSEYRQENQILLLLRYLRQHPGLALSVSYGMLTLCGILYSASFYHEFNISILKLANVSDLLMSGLSEPAALLMFLGGLLMAISADVLSRYTHRIQEKWSKRPASVKRTFMLTISFTPKKNENVMLMVLGIFILYAYLFVSEFAEWHADRIKQGHGEKITVFSQSLSSKVKHMTLLGSTTTFLFTYDKEQAKAVIIPIENIDKLNTSADDQTKKS